MLHLQHIKKEMENKTDKFISFYAWFLLGCSIVVVVFLPYAVAKGMENTYDVFTIDTGVFTMWIVGLWACLIFAISVRLLKDGTIALHKYIKKKLQQNE